MKQHENISNQQNRNTANVSETGFCKQIRMLVIGHCGRTAAGGKFKLLEFRSN